jgi:hypothetical protein
MDVMIVLPSSLANEWRIRIKATADVLSRPLVGSSSKMIDGSVNNSCSMNRTCL